MRHSDNMLRQHFPFSISCAYIVDIRKTTGAIRTSLNTYIILPQTNGCRAFITGIHRSVKIVFIHVFKQCPGACFLQFPTRQYIGPIQAAWRRKGDRPDDRNCIQCRSGLYFRTNAWEISTCLYCTGEESQYSVSTKIMHLAPTQCIVSQIM